MKGSYQVIFEDNDIIVVDKKANVLTIPDRFDPTRSNLKSILASKYKEIFVVHRLDLETSGLIVFAKNEVAHQHLSLQFQERTVTKIYTAICQAPLEDSGIIDKAITESKTKKGKYIAALKGKESITEYKVVQKLNQYAVVELNLLTGRTHQIRVHMNHIGASLIVDKKYGLYSEFKLSQIKKLKFNRNYQERPLLSRSALHASRLTIKHPKTAEEMTFEAPLHKDMKAVIFQLEKVVDKRRLF